LSKHEDVSDSVHNQKHGGLNDKKTQQNAPAISMTNVIIINNSYKQQQSGQHKKEH